MVVIGETAWGKKGQRSVGVHRYLNRMTGQHTQGQVALFLSYHTPQTQVLCDRRLFLPEAWCQDLLRRTQAKVPEDVVFQEKPALALAMLEKAWQWHMPMEWVVGDAGYGDAPQLRQAVAEQGYQYVLAVSPETLVWPTRPGEPLPQASTVAALVATHPATVWERLHLSEGRDEWAATRIREYREGKPGPEGWLLAQRVPTRPLQITYYLSNALRFTSTIRLAQVASSRARMGRCLDEAQREVGLADYEVRYWHSWYRHITLAMLASAWRALCGATGIPVREAYG